MATSSRSSIPKIVWGKHVNPKGLPILYKGEGAPKKHIRGVHPPAGVDNMMLKTTDVFRIPGMGEFTVDFKGYFQVTRSEPDNPEFSKATVYVNFTDLRLFGEHPVLGEIMVDLNPNVVSAGNTYPSRNIGLAACKINVAARFHISKLNMVLFNRTPIQLTNENVKGIPTIGEGGKANVFALPLYNWKEKNGNLFGYVEELEYMVLNYADKPTAESYRKAKTIRQLDTFIKNKNLWNTDQDNIAG